MEKKIENINLNLTLNVPEKIAIVLEKISKHLLSLKNFYEKNIGDEEHWIYASLEDMIENDDNYDQNEIKMLKSTTTLKVIICLLDKYIFLQVLQGDPLKRLNIYETYKELINKLESSLGENIKIGQLHIFETENTQ